jgi:hypothetical protein
LDARSLNTEQVTVNEREYLNSLKGDIDKILLDNKGVDLQILIPIRLKTALHWATAQLNVSQDQKIEVLIYDSAYENTLVKDDIIFELKNLYNINIFVPVKHAQVEKIQNPTGTKLINVYCGGYTAHLIANLAVSQKPAWGDLDSIDSNQRLDDAILVNQYLPLQAKSFAKEGDNFESKKISQQKDHQRLELANKYFDSKKENLNKILAESGSNFDELFKFLDSYGKQWHSVKKDDILSSKLYKVGVLA